MDEDIGIYKITCLPTQMVYVGQSINIKSRWNQHLNELRNNKHCNGILQEDFLKYGEINFNFEIIALCELETLNMLEHHYVKKYEESNRSYNIMPGGGGKFRASVELTPDEYRIVQKFKENQKMNIININPYLCLAKVYMDNKLVSLRYAESFIDKQKKTNNNVGFVFNKDPDELDLKEVLSIASMLSNAYICNILKNVFKEVKDIIRFYPLYNKSDLDKKHLMLQCEVIKTGEKFNKNIYF